MEKTKITEEVPAFNTPGIPQFDLSEAVKLLNQGKAVNLLPSMILDGQYYVGKQREYFRKNNERVKRNKDNEITNGPLDAQTYLQIEVFDEKGINYGSIKTFLAGKAHSSYRSNWIEVPAINARFIKSKANDECQSELSLSRACRGVEDRSQGSRQQKTGSSNYENKNATEPVEELPQF